MGVLSSAALVSITLCPPAFPGTRPAGLVARRKRGAAAAAAAAGAFEKRLRRRQKVFRRRASLYLQLGRVGWRSGFCLEFGQG